MLTHMAVGLRVSAPCHMGFRYGSSKHSAGFIREGKRESLREEESSSKTESQFFTT